MSPRLRELGFAVEHFGDNTWLIRAVPAIGSDRDPHSLFLDVVTEMLDVDVSRAGAADRARWSVACHSSIRAGDRLSIPEMQALLNQLARCDLGRTCPPRRRTIGPPSFSSPGRCWTGSSGGLNRRRTLAGVRPGCTPASCSSAGQLLPAPG